MNSAIYKGVVKHSRFVPKQHDFSYKLFMTYLDLDEIGTIFKGIPFWSDNNKKSLAYFNRNDYLKPNDTPLKGLVRKIIFEKCKVNHSGPIRMLTHMRILGCCFNPVTFYYCFNNSDTKLEFVLAEITNTPWKERHQYLIDLRQKNNMQFTKKFHISPFMDMDMQYDWKFTIPSESLVVDMKVYKDELYLNAKLSLKRFPITRNNMMSLLLKSSFINHKVILGIYWQAAKLYLKGIPFYSHPKDGKNE
ncbi:DUF1365 domain-containing protein [Gammaproteobacteria bacterium]|nr:DUF1365 domain-containing protein [Gammaproteobacteria bacterium]